MEKQIEKIIKNLKSVKGSLAVEGIYLTAEEEKLIIAKALGEITQEEFEQIVLEIIKKD